MRVSYGLASIVLTLSPASFATPPFLGTIFLDPDIITSADATVYESLTAIGQGEREMFDRRTESFELFNAHLFEASYADGTVIEIQVNPEFTAEAAEQLAERFAFPIGQLPRALRQDVLTVWIHADVYAFGGGNNNLLIHTGQADLYEQAGILEETLIHEATHTSLDSLIISDPAWVNAQQADGEFISTYAADFPDREDVAESFLPWLIVRQRTDRVEASLIATIQGTIPNRLAYFDELMLDLSPLDNDPPQLDTVSSRKQHQ